MFVGKEERLSGTQVESKRRLERDVSEKEKNDRNLSRKDDYEHNFNLWIQVTVCIPFVCDFTILHLTHFLCYLHICLFFDFTSFLSSIECVQVIYNVTEYPYPDLLCGLS